MSSAQPHQHPEVNHSESGPVHPVRRVLVTGATGYVGGRLIPRLLEAGYDVRVLVRGGANRVAGRSWADDVEVAVGDVLQPETLGAAMDGVDAAYYLIHSMAGSDDFAERDIHAAQNFAAAAAKKNVQQLIYVGGLGDPESDLSEHLRSRQATGDALRSTPVPVTEFRAGMVVGSGSISFEMLRSLVERLPIMICPKWVYTKTQPIAVRDVLSYLIGALEQPDSRGRIIEIGGADVLTYRDMMVGYADARELRRWFVGVPVLTPRLSSYWVHLVTPVPASVARPLILGLRNEMVADQTLAHALFPEIQPLDFKTAVKLALTRIEQGKVETIWSDALVSSRAEVPDVYLTEEQGLLIERRRRVVAASPATTYRVIAGIGGARGWPAFNWLWEVRGLMDRAVGGVGMRRGRRHPDELRIGDALDFWRVEAVEPGKMLVLRAEMKLPGQGWLQFKINPGDQPGTTELIQTAYFAAKGLFGWLYWYGIYWLHGAVFSRMIDNLAEQVEQAEAASHQNVSASATTSTL